VLLIDDANPVFTAPKAWNVKASLEKIPYIASFATFLDETSVLSDLILPDHSFLESWVDARPESGALVAVAAAAGPAMKPLHQTRAMPDVLLDVSKKLQTPLKLEWETFDAMISEGFAKLPESEAGDAWTVAQAQGGWWGDLPAAAAVAAPAGRGRAAAPAAGAPSVAALKFTEPAFDGAPGEYPFYFQPYASVFLDGSYAHLPWLQELPDPMTSAMWSNWVEINPATASKLRIAAGDMVEIKSTQGAVQAPAVITPGIAPDLIAMPVGQGHENFTRYASGRGSNPAAILAPVTDAETGALAWAATRVQIRRVGEPAAGRLVLFAGEQRDIEDVRER
jgi:anaerobic selenocysteine-containing dehydrogenase